MEVAKEKLEGNKVELKVEIEVEKVDDALNKAYRKVVKDVSLPGFRKGKVPRKILEARYGKEILHKDAVDILLPPAYSQAVKAAEIEPIDQPEISDFYIAENEPANFKAVVEVKPDVELGEYTGLGIEKEEVKVEEEEIDGQINQIMEQHSQLESTDRDIIQDEDFVIIDFEGYLDGETFPGGSAEEFTLEIGSDTFIPGFEEKLIGEKVGEEVEIDVTFPEEYQAEDLAGQDAVFKVNIKEIKEKKTPELDDDFAREASDFDSLDEFKEDIRKNLKEQKENRVEREYENELLEAVSENAKVDVPDPLIENELEMMFRNLSFSLSQQGLNAEQYFKHVGMDKDEWREQNREEAAKRAKNNLVLEEIAEKEGIEISDEEIDIRIEEIAKDSEKELDEIKAYMQINGQLDGLVHSMEINKTIDFLKENN